ncbi:ATP-binding protein [uncultured Croceitalea sp.]|uniref:tetratricopeptide repeat-containing sensor histidine kinase n=1 Tax=uncultured Croceitalea sp. TaxID=1798908 RepID=UPI0033064F7E
MLFQSFLYFEKSDYESFVNLNKLLVQKSEQISNEHLKAKAYFNIGYYYDELNRKTDSAYYYYELSNISNLKIGDSSEIGAIKLNMAMLLRSNNDFFRAKEVLTESLKFLKKEKDDRFLASVYDQLGVNNRKLLNLSEAISYHKKAIEISDSQNDILAYKNNLAVAHRENGDYLKSINLLNNILSSKLLKKESSRYARILNNLAYSQWKNESNKRVDTFLEALKIRKRRNDESGLVSSYTNLAEYYLEQDAEKVKLYTDSLILLSKKLKIPRAEIDALQFLMKLEPNNLIVRNRYIDLKDSLYKNELKVKTQFAYLEFQNKQEKERLLALEAETAKQENQLAQQKTQKVIFISLISTLLMAGGSLFFILRQRHKKEKLKEIYNTEKRISEELHNGLANDVFGLMTRIQSKKNTTEDVIDSLDTIYQTTRQISHKNSAIKTGPEFKEELAYLINMYQDENMTIVSKGLGSIDWTTLGDQKCIALHRSLREILTNLRKHANATLVSIQFKKDEKGVHVTYIDNGVGLKDDAHHGIGLAHIKSRMQSVDGRFKIYQNVKTGTKMELVLT